MPGAGAYPAGIGPAGFDDPANADSRSAPLPVAAFYDPATRTFPQNDDGEAVGVHPVDQEVAIRVTIPKGSIRCAPNVGISWARLRVASSRTMQKTVDDEVKASLATLIEAGDITLYGSPLHEDAHGAPLFYVDYRNNRLQEDRRIGVTS